MRLRNIPGSEETIGNSRWCVQAPEKHKGSWQKLFQNQNPIHIEIGMGKGDFLLALAEKNPEINYIGIEKYSSVLLRALQKIAIVQEETSRTCTNIKFIRMDAEDINEIFAENEIDRIYLNFSDPWPKDRHAKRRLTSKQFLARYDRLLTRTGQIEFKTDNKDLFDFSIEQISDTNWQLTAFTFDLHQDQELSQGNIMTEYEKKFSALGHPICKLIAERLPHYDPVWKPF